MAEAQAAISTPTTPTPTRPARRTARCPGAGRPGRPGPSGTTSSTSRYGSSATAGASRNTGRSAPRGAMSSFCTNLTPSAISCAQPWKPPAYIGPSRPCMCAITLCSVCPTSSGRAGTRPAPPPRGPPAPARPASVTACGAPLARRRYARRAHRLPPARPRRAARPGSLAPGQALATRAASTKSLRSGCPSNSGGQQQRRQVRVAGEADAEHLVRLPLVPGRARVDVDDRVHRRRSARHQGAHQHPVPVPGSTTGGPPRGSRPPARPPRTASRRSRSRARCRRGRPAPLDPGRRRHVHGGPGVPVAGRDRRLSRRHQRDQPRSDSSGVMRRS